MGGKGRKRRAKNFLAAHGGNSRLPPPPTSSSINALPSKLRTLLSHTLSSFPTTQGSEDKLENIDQPKTKKLDASEKDSKSTQVHEKRDKKSTIPQLVAEEGIEIANIDENEEKKQKKRKRKQVQDLRFDAELEKLGGISKRKQRKKEFLKTKKKKKKNGMPEAEETLDLPKHDEVKFGEVVQAPPKFSVIPKGPKKPIDASQERLRLQAIEAYRNRKGWISRPGILLPPISTSSEL